MTEKIPLVAPLVDVKGCEFRQFEPKQAEAIVEVFFGRGRTVMHDSYTFEDGVAIVRDQGQIHDLNAFGDMKVIDWNTDNSTGYISLEAMPVFAVTAELNTSILMVGERKDGKISVVHRFWKEPVELPGA